MLCMPTVLGVGAKYRVLQKGRHPRAGNAVVTLTWKLFCLDVLGGVLSLPY